MGSRVPPCVCELMARLLNKCAKACSSLRASQPVRGRQGRPLRIFLRACEIGFRICVQSGMTMWLSRNKWVKNAILHFPKLEANMEVRSGDSSWCVTKGYCRKERVNV